MSRVRCVLQVVLVSTAVLLLPGCLLVAAGAAGGAVAGTAYVMGDLETTLQATPGEVVAATRTAFEQMGVATISAGATELDGKVIGRTATDEKITVTVESKGRNLSELSIRVGTFGDEELSRQIYDKIRANLPARPARNVT